MTTIRKAMINDLELLQSLWKKLHIYEEQFSDEFDENWAYSKKGSAKFENRLKGRNSIVFIAENNGKPVGFAVVHVSKTIMRHIDKIGLLEYLYVENDFRKKGVGTMLLRKVKNFLRNKKISRIKLTTFSANSNAIKFYKDHGIDDFVTILEGDL